MNKKPFPLLSVTGVEIEWMIVSKKELEIQSIADIILTKLAGHLCEEISLGTIAVSNELALHVIELKTDGPVEKLQGIDQQFHQVAKQINDLLQPLNACLLPTGAHPWFQPHKDTPLWPHGNREIYQSFHRIFHCEGHGWTNLQSVHINLPFADDREFALLHNAIRLVLPLIPAITGSTPYLNGKNQLSLNTRLNVYADNQKAIPAITGLVIPEYITSEAEYQSQILQPMYDAIKPHDTEGLLQYEWLNSRGAIARFDRNAIEIRIMDTQECPRMDLALVALIREAIRDVIEKNRFSENPIATADLRKQYDAALNGGIRTPILLPELISQYGIDDHSVQTAREVWQIWCDRAWNRFDERMRDSIEIVLTQGNLAERILAATNGSDEQVVLSRVYHQLADCLNANEAFFA